jgi:hypothetical protein
MSDLVTQHTHPFSYNYLSIRDNKTAYNVEKYFPEGDHGSILLTTRLAKLGQLGTSLKLKAVDDMQARSMMANSLGRTFEGRFGRVFFLSS